MCSVIQLTVVKVKANFTLEQATKAQRVLDGAGGQRHTAAALTSGTDCCTGLKSVLLQIGICLASCTLLTVVQASGCWYTSRR
jgi:hypothetical protein